MNWDQDLAANDVSLGIDGNATRTVCFDNTIPAFVEAAIERCYGSLFATLPHLRHTGKLTATTSTYVQYVDGKVRALLLFDQHDRQITVLNELIQLSKQEIAAFVAFVFARYVTIAAVSFNAVRADLTGLDHPVQRYFCSEDIVVSSLVNLNDYTERMKKSTRKSIRRHGNALLRAHPAATFNILSAPDIDDALVRKIIGFNKARMANKDRVSAYTVEESRWITALASTRGMAMIVTIDEQVCAGAVCCQVGNSFFMLVAAHDPAYDQFGMGMLCSYRAVCACIARDATAVHFLWGRLAYKTSLGGTPQRFDRITVYRNRMAYLRHLKQAMFAAVNGLMREMRLYLLNAEGEPTARGRIADLVWRWARRLKRAVGSVSWRS